jgi:hypothetical protein
MRGIDRVLAVIVLVGAVGGAAAFARYSGGDSSAHAVSLAAPPLQHIGAPGIVLFAHTPGPTRVAVDVRRQRPQAPTRAPAGGITIPKAPLPRHVAAGPSQTPAPTPATTPIPTPISVPAPVLPPEPPRALAAVPIAPAQPDAEHQGRALGHVKHHGHDTPPYVDAPAVPVPAPAQAPADSASLDPSSPDPSGSGHGHGWSHTNGRATPDDD